MKPVVSEQRGRLGAQSRRGGHKLAAGGCRGQLGRARVLTVKCEGSTVGGRQPEKWAGPDHRGADFLG